MIDSGRRIGSWSSQLRCTKQPGVAARAHFGALQSQDELVAGEALVREDLGASSKIVPRWAAWPRIIVRSLRVHVSLQNCRRACTLRDDGREHGHAHGDAVRDLLLDHGLRSVGHFAGDLHIAVHRARMHHDRARPRLLQRSAVMPNAR